MDRRYNTKPAWLRDSLMMSEGGEPVRPFFVFSRFSQACTHVSSLLKHHEESITGPFLTDDIDVVIQSLVRDHRPVVLIDATEGNDVSSSKTAFPALLRHELRKCTLAILVAPGRPISLELARWIDDFQAETVLAPITKESLDRLIQSTPRGLRRRAPAELSAAGLSFVTREPTLSHLLEDLRLVSAHDVAVLFVGETGTGKTTLARLLHDLSPRASEPLLHIACGAVPPTLFESELFGHVRGAFTGADRDKVGKLEVAGKGTILLDEIDTLSLEQQAKLLRVLETFEFEPVGSNETKKLQARIIVASNVCLEMLVENGRFRKDLYYRLNVMRFDVPALRERTNDILTLALDFIRSASVQCRVPVRQIDLEFLAMLKAYHWPGNLRELRNSIERSVVLCREGRLTTACLPSAVAESRTVLENALERTPARLADKVAVSERQLIEEVLKRNGNRRALAAQELGVSRVTLYNKMKKYGMLGRP